MTSPSGGMTKHVWNLYAGYGLTSLQLDLLFVNTEYMPLGTCAWLGLGLGLGLGLRLRLGLGLGSGLRLRLRLGLGLPLGTCAWSSRIHSSSAAAL